jgi:hypothetical protein
MGVRTTRGSDDSELKQPYSVLTQEMGVRECDDSSVVAIWHTLAPQQNWTA